MYTTANIEELRSAYELLTGKSIESANKILIKITDENGFEHSFNLSDVKREAELTALVNYENL